MSRFRAGTPGHREAGEFMLCLAKLSGIERHRDWRSAAHPWLAKREGGVGGVGGLVVYNAAIVLPTYGGVARVCINDLCVYERWMGMRLRDLFRADAVRDSRDQVQVLALPAELPPLAPWVIEFMASRLNRLPMPPAPCELVGPPAAWPGLALQVQTKAAAVVFDRACEVERERLLAQQEARRKAATMAPAASVSAGAGQGGCEPAAAPACQQAARMRIGGDNGGEPPTCPAA